jgi:hypothetical protein
LRPMFWGWFRAVTHAERQWRYPGGPSEISVTGVDPAHILVLGDGPAAGCGVRNHQLGVAGYLARHVAEHLDRGTLVTVMAQPTASARSTRRLLDDVRLGHFDAIVLMLATTDSSSLTARYSWRRDMTAIVRTLKSTGTPSVFVTSTAHLDEARATASFARALTGAHARMLDAETSRICAKSKTPMIALDAANDLTSRVYATWGRRIGANVADSLSRSRTPTNRPMSQPPGCPDDL